MTLLSINWPHVWIVTGLGFLTVVSLLVFLIFVMKLLGIVITNTEKTPVKSVALETSASAKTEHAPLVPTSSVNDDLAAIAMALHLYFNRIHDTEPTEINIKSVEPDNSPWNFKLYGMNNLHR